MSTVHRFPKWLADERYEITHAPALAQPFGVVIFDKVSGRFVGNGQSIAQAAKAALKMGEKSTAENAETAENKKVSTSAPSAPSAVQSS